MKKRMLLLIPLYFVFLAAETCFGPVWFDCMPPFLLCFTVYCAVFINEKAAAAVGLLSGLILDVSSSYVFGLRAVLYLLIGYLAGILAETVLSRNLFSALLLGVFFCFAAEAAVWGVLCLKTPIPFRAAAWYVLLPRTAMSLPLLLLLYPVFRKFPEKLKIPGRR